MSAIAKFTIKDMIQSGVHFGHKKMKWNPLMSPYIFGVKNGIHIINLQKTYPMLCAALQHALEVASNNGRILFVGTKKQAQDIIANEAERCGQYYINKRWLGGTLTNWRTVSNSIDTLNKLEKEIEFKKDNLTKKELLFLNRKREKLLKNLGGIRNMGGKPDLLIVVDSCKEHIAIKEAKKIGSKVICLVDSNGSIDDIDYIVPGNDDAIRSIEFITKLFSETILSGMKDYIEKSGEVESEGENKNNNPSANKKNDKPKKETGSNMNAKKDDYQINASDVKKIREVTGAGMMDCKKALVEANGDSEEAIKIIKIKYAAKVAKKSDREVKQGIVALSSKGDEVAILEVNCETDFVARNSDFQKNVEQISQVRLNYDSHEDFLNGKFDDTNSVQDQIKNMIGVIGENLQIGESEKFSGIVGTYLHNKLSDNSGLLGVLVKLESDIENNKDKLVELANNIALHVAASNPESIDRESLNPAILEKQREVFAEQSANSGKDEKIVAKMVEGKVNKFYKEIILLEQEYVVDTALTIKALVESYEKELGGKISIAKFSRIKIGE